MLRFLPVLSRARSKLFAAPPLLEVAAEVREIEPASTIECPAPIALPNELERVRRFHDGREAQVPRLLARVQQEQPTLSYLLPDAVLADFTVYCGGSYGVYASSRKRPMLTGTVCQFEEAQLCTTSCAQTYFGHLIHDELPLELLARQQDLIPLTFDRRPWLHESAYRSLVELTPVTSGLASVRNLWITDERALNQGWVSRFEELRRQVRSKVPPTGGTHVFIRRGRLANGRHMQNEDEFAEQLVSIGFRVIEPESMTAHEIVAAIAGARVVCSVEGSAQQHALIAMPKGAALLTIQPPFQFNSLPKIVADRIGVAFAYHVAEPSGSGFSVDFNRFRRTLDLLQ